MRKTFLRDEQGQDLIEYASLLAFIALGTAALFINASVSIKAIWTNASTNLASGASRPGRERATPIELACSGRR